MVIDAPVLYLAIKALASSTKAGSGNSSFGGPMRKSSPISAAANIKVLATLLRPSPT